MPACQPSEAYSADARPFAVAHYARADQEGRTLLHELFATAGDIRVTDRELHITLAPLSAPRLHARSSDVLYIDVLVAHRPVMQKVADNGQLFAARLLD